MDTSQKGKDDNEQPPEKLADKYRVSWQQATDSQRQALCKRFGLGYTTMNDEALLQQVANKQQASYRRSTVERQRELAERKEQATLRFALRNK